MNGGLKTRLRGTHLLFVLFMVTVFLFFVCVLTVFASAHYVRGFVVGVKPEASTNEEKAGKHLSIL